MTTDDLIEQAVSAAASEAWEEWHAAVKRSREGSPRPSLQKLWDLPPLLDIARRPKSTGEPTAAELLGGLATSTAYRLAHDWPTVMVGGRKRVQTVPFVKKYLGVDLLQDDPRVNS